MHGYQWMTMDSASNWQAMARQALLLAMVGMP